MGADGGVGLIRMRNRVGACGLRSAPNSLTRRLARDLPGGPRVLRRCLVRALGSVRATASAAAAGRAAPGRRRCARPRPAGRAAAASAASARRAAPRRASPRRSDGRAHQHVGRAERARDARSPRPPRPRPPPPAGAHRASPSGAGAPPGACDPPGSAGARAGARRARRARRPGAGPSATRAARSARSAARASPARAGARRSAWGPSCASDRQPLLVAAQRAASGSRTRRLTSTSSATWRSAVSRSAARFSILKKLFSAAGTRSGR